MEEVGMASSRLPQIRTYSIAIRIARMTKKLAPEQKGSEAL